LDLIERKIYFGCNCEYIFAMNLQIRRIIDCSEADNQINHYIHFKIIYNKHICIKNDIESNNHPYIL